jgi:hypothetical protein
MAVIYAGDRLISPKQDLSFIKHHAIFVGDIDGVPQVVENQINVGVRLVPLDRFWAEHPECIIENFRGQPHERDEIVRKSLNNLGRTYKLLDYNCESFANEVQHGKSVSKQVQNGLAAVGLTIGAIFFTKWMKNNE